MRTFVRLERFDLLHSKVVWYFIAILVSAFRGGLVIFVAILVYFFPCWFVRQSKSGNPVHEQQST
jgi:hypothetical protein